MKSFVSNYWMSTVSLLACVAALNAIFALKASPSGVSPG